MSNETFADNDITSALTAASRAIDELCGRRFYTTASDETRYFTVYGNTYAGVPSYPGYPGYGAALAGGRIKVGDLISVTSLSTDPSGNGTYTESWAATDYTLEPFNNGLDGKPYRYITRHPLGSFYFPIGYPKAIRVVGRFGWSTPPAQVVDATTILASRLLKRKREAPFGVVTVGIDTGAIARISSVDPDVKFLLQPFMEAPFA